MTKEEKIERFDPSSVGLDNGQIFGFPFSVAEANYIILPIPWEATVSFGSGTGNNLKEIIEASAQLDFYYSDFPEVWKEGIALYDAADHIKTLSDETRDLVLGQIQLLESGNKCEEKILETINRNGSQLNEYVRNQYAKLNESGKKVVLLGGDHSTPLGAFEEASKKHNFGILSIDAHLDLRKAYEGFEFSHASIMYNALERNYAERLVVLGARDYCQEEVDYVKSKRGKIQLFPDHILKEAMFEGATWKTICYNILKALPEKVYISIDIDGLSPSLCPNTGTPVPGGLSFEQLIYLLKAIAQSGKEIVGIDLVEVGASQWDANVAARIIYQAIGYWHVNQQQLIQ